MDDKEINSLNLTSPADVCSILEELGVRPLKSLGQNFLIDANILGIILETAEPAPDDCVLEIGAGLGALTEALAARCRKVVAIEKDSRLAAFLKRRFAPRPNIELIAGDALRVDLKGILASGITKIVANLPYSVGSAILVEVFKGGSFPSRIVVTLQAEVGRRLTAEPGGKDYCLLSIWSKLRYEARIKRMISPNCFLPRPLVQSAVVRLDLRGERASAPVDPDFFFGITKYAFGQRRKQLQKIILHAPPQFSLGAAEVREAFSILNLDPRARPEALTLPEWINLANAVYRLIVSRKA